MKASMSLLFTACFIIGLSGTIIAQNEGKHLGSTQDAQRSGEPIHTRMAAQSSNLPNTNTAGGDYRNNPYELEQGMYLDQQWQPGYVVLDNGERMDHLLMRYDIYNQQMQFIQDEDTLAFSNPGELNYLFMDGKKFVYMDFDNNGVADRGYFEVLKDGDCQLLLRRMVTHHIHTDGISGSEKDEYIRDVSYYVKKEGKNATAMRACKKGVLDVFQDKEEEIKQFMKTNNLKMKTCDDLMLVVAFYNSLD